MQRCLNFSKKMLTLMSICLFPLAVMAADQTEFNGDIKLKSLSKVGGNIQSMNGKITLVQALVEGQVTLVNGDIILKQGANIKGGILIGNEKRADNANNPLPLLRISADSVVDGKIILKQKVRLDIAKGAQVGEVVSLY